MIYVTRHVQAVGQRLGIAALGQLQPALDFLAQLRFDLVGVRPRQRLVFAGVGGNLGAVQRDVPQLEQLHLARQQQNLHEQFLHLLQKTGPEVRQRVVVRVGVGRHEPEGHRVAGRPLDLAAGVHPAGAAVDQQAQQHRRVVRLRASLRVLARQLAQVELLDHFHHETRASTGSGR